MKALKSRRTRPPFALREFLAVIWGHGDRLSRGLAVYIFVGYTLPILPAIWTLLNYPREVEYALGLVWLSGVLYMGSFSTGILTAPVLRETVRRGWTAPDDEYYLQLAEYQDHFGRNGRGRGDVGWSIGFWVIWYSTMGSAILFSVSFLPSLKDWTPYVFFAGVNVPVIVVSLLFQRRRTARTLREATSRGYRLEELFPKPTRTSETTR